MAKYKSKRERYRLEFSQATSFEERLISHTKLQKLPRNSSSTRLRNRCWKTGRPRGYFRFFGLCRNAVRELGHDCLLPGVTKASW